MKTPSQSLEKLDELEALIVRGRDCPTGGNRRGCNPDKDVRTGGINALHLN